MAKLHLIIFALAAFVPMLSLQAQGRVLKQRVSKLHFYFHDTVAGQNVTAVRVAQAATTNTSKTGFGIVAVIDDMLTEGPHPSSKLVGRAQGMYTATCLEEVHLLMTMSFVFQSGKHKGSTLSILGNNAVFDKVREFPVVGGSGVFRMAHGYAFARTHSLDLKTGNAVVEYTVTAIHYS